MIGILALALALIVFTILAAIFFAFGSAVLVLAICCALGSIAVSVLLVSLIGMFVLARGMVRRLKAWRSTRDVDVYGEPFGDYPHAYHGGRNDWR